MTDYSAALTKKDTTDYSAAFGGTDYSAAFIEDEAKTGIRGKFGIPEDFDLREKVGGIAEKGLEYWREKTETEPLRKGAGAFGEGGDIDVILSNIRSQALSVPRFPIDIAQQVLFDEEGQVRSPLEAGKRALRTGGEFLEYGRKNIENYATYVSPFASAEAKQQAIAEIAEDPLGLAFTIGIAKGGLKGARRLRVEVAKLGKGKKVSPEPMPEIVSKPIERVKEEVTPEKVAVDKAEQPFKRAEEVFPEKRVQQVLGPKPKPVPGQEALATKKALIEKGVTEQPPPAPAGKPAPVEGKLALSILDVQEVPKTKRLLTNPNLDKASRGRLIKKYKDSPYSQEVELHVNRPLSDGALNDFVRLVKSKLPKGRVGFRERPIGMSIFTTQKVMKDGTAKIYFDLNEATLHAQDAGFVTNFNKEVVGALRKTTSLKELEKPTPTPKLAPAPTGKAAPGDIVELHAGIPIPDVVKKHVENVANKLFGKSESVIEQKTWQIKRDWYYKKEGLTWEHMDKWDRELRDQFTKKEREDMMFYRQRTGNIFKKGDTPEAVESRLSQKAKGFVDGEINEHIKNMRKWYNESPWTKDIVARAEVIKTYLTGVYSGNIKKGYDYLVGLKGRSFVTNNFMRNKKTYLSFDEAFREAGLVPRFRDMADQLQYQDAYLIKNLANNELIGKIHKLEKQIDTKLMVRSNSKLYDQAKSEGWVPYDDPYLRSYVAGKKADGSPAWATTKAPALLHPELSKVLVDVFRKDAFKPDAKFWRGYDTATDFIRTVRVSLSGFHFIPLAESLVGGKGIGALNIPAWIQRGRGLLHNPEFMTEALGSGLRITAPREVAVRATFGKIQGIVNRLEAQGGLKKAGAIPIRLAAFIPRQITHFLFHKYMPLLKVNIFMDYKHVWLKTMDKQGIKITEAMRKEALTDIAKLTNDQFGAQAWTLMRTWNDPKVMKWIHRAVGYPDWTISALRQAGAGLEGGIRGKLGRRYWLRYGIAFLTAQQAMNYLNTGFYNKEDGSIGWSLDKAHSTFENEDPTHKLDFQLPDIEFTVAGKRINLGREAKHDEEGNFTGWGRKRYSHFGKQMLEIPRYATNTISQTFAKSAPLIQIGLTQVMGGKPFKGEIFPARGEFVEGEFKAWGGTKVGTGARQVERVMQLVSDVLPFSIQQIRQTGPGTATLTPISKGLSLWASRDYMEKAIKTEDPDKLRQIIEVLVDGGYSGDSITRTITLVVNRIKKETE